MGLTVASTVEVALQHLLSSLFPSQGFVGLHSNSAFSLAIYYGGGNVCAALCNCLFFGLRQVCCISGRDSHSVAFTIGRTGQLRSCIELIALLQFSLRSIESIALLQFTAFI